VTTTRIKSPADCSPAELDAFETQVREGGEVTPAGLRQRICNASHLLFLYDSSDTLCGISALKHPNGGYRSEVFRQAHASVSPASYPVELGWVFVPPSHQGQRLSRPLVEQLLPYAAGNLVYGTTRADNERMHRTLARYGFHQDGVAYRRHAATTI
jgi:GNAT superfamily N-acetyltransferase